MPSKIPSQLPTTARTAGTEEFETATTPAEFYCEREVIFVGQDYSCRPFSRKPNGLRGIDGRIAKKVMLSDETRRIIEKFPGLATDMVSN
ncbi:MAG: hypothetical protein KDA80_16750 [Planctomycetaceae bacterium]|nr:hypothetical protein [Planctomycetaceae bacterium]